MQFKDKVSAVNRLLERYGYSPANMNAFEIVGERKSAGLVEDIDVVLFDYGLKLAVQKYFGRIKGVTQNIHAMYELSFSSRINMLSLINEDPEFKGRFDFFIEKGFIIGPGNERLVYLNLAKHKRKEIGQDAQRRSLDEVLIKVECGVRSPK